MEIEIQWNKPIPLKKVNKGALIYDIDLEKVPDKPGIYIFARRFNRTYYALYVGQSAGNIRRRIRTHLNSLRLMRHLESTKIGKRVLITGIPLPKGGQNSEKIIKILERTFIRHFVSEGHDLVNISGSRIRYHKINSKGRIPKKFLPSSIFLER
jgi:hypothetical protein